MVKYRLLVPRNTEYETDVIEKIRQVLEVQHGRPVWLVLSNQRFG